MDLKDLETNAFLAQAETLAQLTAHPAWEVYAGLLRDMRQAALEELAHATPDTFRHWQGVAATLAEMLDRPARIIQAADAFTRAEEADKRVYRPELRAVLGVGMDEDGDV